jgi:hypothetical protein
MSGAFRDEDLAIEGLLPYERRRALRAIARDVETAAGAGDGIDDDRDAHK